MESGYNVWNYTINRITFKRGKEIDEQFSRAEWQIHFRQGGRQFAFFQWNSPVLRSFDQSPTLFHFDLEEKEESWRGVKKGILGSEKKFYWNRCMLAMHRRLFPRFDVHPFWRFLDIFWRIILPQIFPDRPFSIHASSWQPFLTTVNPRNRGKSWGIPKSDPYLSSLNVCPPDLNSFDHVGLMSRTSFWFFVYLSRKVGQISS